MAESACADDMDRFVKSEKFFSIPQWKMQKHNTLLHSLFLLKLLYPHLLFWLFDWHYYSSLFMPVWKYTFTYLLPTLPSA